MENNIKTPLIGVSDNFRERRHDLRTDYTEAIYNAGGAPVIIPYNNDIENLRRVVCRMDGVLLTGGGDINPKYWNEPLGEFSGEPNNDRDAYDIAIIKLCVEQKVPILAICRGLQCVNVYFGGSLYQDLPSELGSRFAMHHQEVPTEQPVHAVELLPESRLAKMIETTTIDTNSHHHQAVNKVGKGLNVTGKTEDGVVEALESSEHDIICVQFHPERMTESSRYAKRIFDAWIEYLTIQKSGKK